MRILIFHGYLLGGTGSNVYNARLAAALVRLGHEVHLCCQDAAPEQHPFVDAVGEASVAGVKVRTLREPVRCTVYRPEIGRLLPVYVQDRYAGFDARRFTDCDEQQIETYLERNAAAVSAIAERVRPDIALANHLVMGPAILARALGRTVPYAVKVHGSALEYTVKPEPARFLPYAREGLERARAVLVGSLHTASSLWEALADPHLPERTRLGPPGVEVEQFCPREPAAAARGLEALAARLQGGAGGGGEGAFARDERAAGAALAQLDAANERLVAFTGKLIVSKGVDLLLAAWPLVRDRVPDARLVVVGFGPLRDTLERIAAPGGERALLELAQRGRALEGGPPGALALLGAFLAANEARRAEGVVFCGRLEHAELAELLPACEAQVVPSTFPEAFGMVAAEAAACGALPISAAHSGLAEVTAQLAAELPQPARPWLQFELGPDAVGALAANLADWLEAPAELREQTRAALAATARERFSWEGVARGVIAAAEGRLGDLPLP